MQGNSFVRVHKQKLYSKLNGLQNSEEEVEQERKDEHKAASVEKMSEAKRKGFSEQGGSLFFQPANKLLHKESCDMSQGNGHQMGRVEGCLRERERQREGCFTLTDSW